MEFPDEADYDTICSSFINPLTALYILKLAEKSKARVIIQSAAWSSIGKMVLRLMQSKGIKVINIVRREEQVEILEDLGANYILNWNEDTFHDELDQLIHSLQPNVFFDWIGGRLVSNIFSKMPKLSSLYIYGNMDEDGDLSITNKELLNSRKSIAGISLGDFLDLM